MAFKVRNRENAIGLMYIWLSLVHTEKYMVGSYPPKKDPHMYLTPVEEAPSGECYTLTV